MSNKKNIITAGRRDIAYHLTASGSFAAGKKRIILIDPAHGGKEQGVKLTGDVYEKNITLAVALAVKKN